MSLKKYLLMLLMIACSIGAIHFQPTHRIAADRKNFVLEKVIPNNFGDWKVDDSAVKGIVNPESSLLINKLYSQTLSRTYINGKGERVMLVIAYGEDQSDRSQLHYPEVCYPAQGFQINFNQPGRLETDKGTIKVRRLVANLSQRVEPIVYWTTIGNKVVLGSTETKLQKLKYGFKGQVPDGILFRVSTISPDVSYAFALELEFVNELIENIESNSLELLTGLSPI